MQKIKIICNNCHNSFEVIYKSNGTNNRKYCEDCRENRMTNYRKQYSKIHSTGQPVGRPKGAIKFEVEEPEFDMKKVFAYDEVSVLI